MSTIFLSCAFCSLSTSGDCRIRSISCRGQSGCCTIRRCNTRESRGHRYLRNDSVDRRQRRKSVEQDEQHHQQPDRIYQRFRAQHDHQRRQKRSIHGNKQARMVADETDAKTRAIIAFFLYVKFVNGVSQQALYFCHLGHEFCNKPAPCARWIRCGRLSLKVILCCSILRRK